VSTLADVEVVAEPRARWRTCMDRVWTWVGDRFNPILVKEARQALKSRQFVITFMLLLLLAWGWTILGVAIMGPGVWYGNYGPQLFFGYYLILAFPLLVIVPFTAFRSLAIEQEDRTYELLWITTLSPRQIIRGKLVSAVLQMLVYLSAISPCLAFTYLLRGIDFPSVLFVVGSTTLGSLGLAMLSLLVGTQTSSKHWQVILSAGVIAGLLLAFFVACSLLSEIIWLTNLPFDAPEFWQVTVGMLTGYVSYFLLVFYAAAAQVSFASDNRSTRLRVIMVVQHLLLADWFAWIWAGPGRGDDDVLYAGLTLLGLHWYVMGALMTGESPELSLRVRRQLPQSLLGRAVLTWFNPGPGTGYVLAVAGVLGALLLACLAVAFHAALSTEQLQRFTQQEELSVLAFSVLGASYVTFYLGLGLLIIRLLRRVTVVSILLAALIQILLLLLGTAVPLVTQLLLPDLRDAKYTLLQLPNPFWSLAYVADRSTLSPEVPILLAVVPLAALAVFLLNLRALIAEVQRVRVERPQRVAEEDAQIAARNAPPEPIHTSPWD